MRFEMESMEQRLLREYFGGDEEKLADAEKRLRNHEPIAYILGETVFFREYYYVTPAVLIPRPDTERVVEKILRHLPENGKMLELCTGSGCISISSLCSTRHTTSVAVDISGEALAVAKKNADRNHVSLRIRFVQGDVFSPFLWQQLAKWGPYDVIAANPPYVCSGVMPFLEEECRFEPSIAFDGGEDGMDFYNEILRYAPSLLKEDGRIIFEIGYDQRQAILSAAEEQQLSCSVTKDYGGNDRVAVMKLSEERRRRLFKHAINTDLPFPNPVADGFYAEPDACYFGGKAYIYTVRSAPLAEQIRIDCFSSEDLRTFQKYENCVNTEGFPYLSGFVNGPTVIEKNGRYYCAFSSGNISKDGEPGGIELAVSDSPAGPFHNYLGRPLLSRFIHGAQPYDPCFFKDDDGKVYLLFGGNCRLILARMNEEMTGFAPSKQRKTFFDLTPRDIRGLPV